MILVFMLIGVEMLKHPVQKSPVPVPKRGLK